MQSISKIGSLRVVVMGVTGCGKTTCALAIAKTLGARFCDGDSLHNPECVKKMQDGIPLNDDDRWPWFGRIAAFLNADSGCAVIACSALKKAYRDFLRREVRNVRFVFLDVSRETATARVSLRQNHYMPASLVESQFVALERPEHEPGVTVVPAEASVGEVVSIFLADLQRQENEGWAFCETDFI